jgi:hypothetical protein
MFLIIKAQWTPSFGSVSLRPVVRISFLAPQELELPNNRCGAGLEREAVRHLPYNGGLDGTLAPLRPFFLFKVEGASPFGSHPTLWKSDPTRLPPSNYGGATDIPCDVLHLPCYVCSLPPSRWMESPSRPAGAQWHREQAEYVRGMS